MPDPEEMMEEGAGEETEQVLTEAGEETEGGAPAEKTDGSGDEVDFSWDDDADADEESEEAEESEESEEKAEGDEYEFSLGEETQIPSEIHGELGAVAKELGLPGDKAAQLLNKALAVYQRQHAELNKELGRELRAEWGNDFNKRLKATKAFAARIGREAGLKAEDMRAMMTPYGVRLLDAMRAKMGESGRLAGRVKAADAKPLTVQQRIEAFHSDPEKMAAVMDPLHPKHAMVNAELNKLYGIPD